jgi:serine/threonine protein kinase
MTTISHRSWGSWVTFPKPLCFRESTAPTSSTTWVSQTPHPWLRYNPTPRAGKLRYISKPRYRPLNAVLRKKYLFSKTDADALASFLTPMLCLHPDKRAKASELIRHNWLDGVLVQGGVDITGQEYARLSGLNESEVDAVDDVVVSGDEEGSREHSPLSPHRPRTPTFVPSPAKTKGNVYAPWRSPVTSKHSRKHSRSGTPNSDDSSNSAESRHSSASSISMRSRGV